MKTSETKTSANTVTHAKNTVSPFFSKEGQGGTSFFGGETMAAESFFSPRTIQPKLTIGKPNDVYEQQADSVADQVVAKLNAPQTPSVPPTLKGSPTVQPKCAACEKEEKLQKKEEDIAPVGEQVQMKPIFDSAAEPPPDDTVQRKCAECEKEEAVQRKTDGNTEGAASPDLSSRLNASKGGGQPLPADTRTSMESAMGADFSNVRVHTGSEAVQMSQGINAQAFTHGSDVYFNEGKFNPSNTEGTRLLAHELTHTVQQGGVQRKLIQTKKEHEHKEDGQGVKKRMHSKVQDEVGDDADFSKSPGQMTDEECKKAKDIDQGKKSQQKAAIKSGGAAKPDVNRPAKEMPKVKGAAEEGKGKMAQPPKQKGGKGKKKEASRAKLESSDAKERSALAAYAKSAKLLMPLKPAELTAPRIEKPKDSKGEEVPANTALDKSVQALHEIAKLFYENAFELKEQAVNDAQEGLKMRGTLDESWAKTRRVTAGSEVMKQDKDAREKINQQEEEALVKVEADTAMVKEGAPRMMEESTKGKDEAGPMVAETTAQKSEMEANVPDDEDAAAEAQKQSEDTGKAADDSQKMDDTLGQTGVRAEKYLQDAVAGEAKNQGTRATIDENKGTLANIGQEISRIDKHNAKSEAQLGALDSYPELVEKQTAKRAESGDQLYAAAVTMNDQLISTQEEYLSSMAALPGKEEAMKKKNLQKKSHCRQKRKCCSTWVI